MRRQGQDAAPSPPLWNGVGASSARPNGAFRSLLDAVPDAMIVVRPGGTIAAVNAQAERLFGYTTGELVDLRVEALVPERFGDAHPGHRDDYFDDPHARAMGTGLDLHALRKDGTEFPVEITLSPLDTGEGTVVMASIRDITERRRAEARFRGLLEAAPDAMIVVDSEGTIALVNAQCEKVFGYSREELVGRSIESLVPGRFEDGHFANVDGAPVRAGLDLQARHKDGSDLHLSLSVSAVIGAEGKIDGAVAIARDVSERKRFESRLRFMAEHDALTGLLNRRRFMEELSHHVQLSERYGPGGAVLLLDLDNFKEINDTLGHGAGDAAVRAVGLALGRRLRASDLLARLGGDEFAVLLPHAEAEGARRVASDLLDALRAHPFFVAGHRVRITTSIGVAPFAPGDEVDAEAVLASADIAMYEAKEAGRDQIAVYSPARGREALLEARLSWPDRIRSALDRGSFGLWLQPIMELTTGRISQAEALVRMHDDDGEAIPPGAFLAAAERSGLVIDLDRWVIRRTIELMAADGGIERDLDVEVNISGRSMGDAELPAMIEATLSEHGVDPARLIFEVTETAAIANMTDAREFAATLTRVGCRFALDDFGAGFGSFYYLKHLPLDFLKIDGDFIRNLPVSEVDQVLVRGMVEVAKGLGVKTVAEFVGDQATLELLREYGVDYAQGFHVGAPQPITAGSHRSAERTSSPARLTP